MISFWFSLTLITEFFHVNLRKTVSHKNTAKLLTHAHVQIDPWEGLPYETDRCLSEIWIGHLKETNLGIAQAFHHHYVLFPLRESFLWPLKETKMSKNIFSPYFFVCNPKRDLDSLKYRGFDGNTLSKTKHPKLAPQSNTTSIPVWFIRESHLPGDTQGEEIFRLSLRHVGSIVH